ncbi:universal stress protein [Achromobacter veterisilvae]|jgi:nucleotide-binding universal stress UspA family protein|uniref:Universal stress protein n=1 Tax=Achromobacter veterisilvae TaxID=2069367 RepID=A0A446CAJ7_9BURK|nr:MULTISPECIES: universal stress protein [Achromobacter]MCW0210982.1 universal stress protein [Achromobacter sp.]SSW64781.1 TRAP-T-associated universal stress protein TeaD [Achromobacter veterisilvae]
MYQRILVPVDGSDTSDLGLTEAIRLAQLTHARLRLIHVIDELSFAFSVDAYSYQAGELLDLLRKNGAEILEKALATVRAQGIAADTVLYENLDKTVQQRVIAEAETWKADLIVIGTHGRRGVRRMVLGSSAEGILRGAHVPVLLVRAPDGTP